MMKKTTFYLFLVLINHLFIYNLVAALPQNIQDTTTSAAPKPIDLIDINYEIERLDKTFKKTENDLGPNARFLAIQSDFKDYKLFLEKEATEFKAYNPYNLSKYFLESTYRSWGSFTLKLTGWQSEVNSMVKSSQDNIASINKIKKTWELTLESEEFESEPQEIKSRVRKTIQRADEIKIKLRNQRRQYVILEDEITDMTSFCNDIIGEVSSLQQNLRDSLFISISPVLWKVKVKKSDVSPVVEKLNKSRHENAKTVKNYIETTNLESIWFAVVIIILLFLSIRYRYIKLNFDDSEPGHKSIFRILIKYPWLSLITLILVAIHFLFPYKPLLTGHIISFVLLINMRYILSSFINQSGRLFISRIILLSILNNLEIVFWYFGSLARYYILFETVIGVLLMFPYLKIIYWKNFKTDEIEHKGILVLALLSFTLYFISLFANLFGYLDLAVLFVKSGVQVPGISIILYGLYKILLVIIYSLIKSVKRVRINYWIITGTRWKKDPYKSSRPWLYFTGFFY